MELDLSSLKDQDLAVLYCGVFIASAKDGRIPLGVRSQQAVDAALFKELKRRQLSTMDAARIATEATEGPEEQ